MPKLQTNLQQFVNRVGPDALINFHKGVISKKKIFLNFSLTSQKNLTIKLKDAI